MQIRYMAINKLKTLQIIAGIAGIVLFISSCNSFDNNKNEQKNKPELLIYCGITMINPMLEIAEYVEKEKNCKIRITKGGSGNLLNAIKINKTGDLYLPGAHSYIQQCKDAGLINMSKLVGYNRAAIIVPEGNPMNIGNDPIVFANDKYKTIFADPNSGSIGRMAAMIFEKRGIKNDALFNVSRLSTDSKDITKAIINGEADIGINWCATTHWKGYEDKLDGIIMDEKYAPIKKLVLARLVYSKYPEIAEFFIKTATDSIGKQIFYKYGFINHDEHYHAHKNKNNDNTF